MLIFLLLLQYARAQYSSYNAVLPRLPGRCHPGDFDCGFGRCIPVTKFHDGRPDCFDGSDEWCFPGQFKCGPYCVALQDTFPCLLNPRCDDSPKQPTWCTVSKEKLCAEESSFPCKGYGECVLWEWLLDGKADCIDKSDEDPDYVRILEVPYRCYFNRTSADTHQFSPLNYSFPLGSLPLLPPATPPVIPSPPCIFCPPNLPKQSGPPSQAPFQFTLFPPPSTQSTNQPPFATLIPPYDIPPPPKDPFDDNDIYPTPPESDQSSISTSNVHISYVTTPPSPHSGVTQSNSGAYPGNENSSGRSEGEQGGEKEGYGENGWREGQSSGAGEGKESSIKHVSTTNKGDGKEIFGENPTGVDYTGNNQGFGEYENGGGDFSKHTTQSYGRTGVSWTPWRQPDTIGPHLGPIQPIQPVVIIGNPHRPRPPYIPFTPPPFPKWPVTDKTPNYVGEGLVPIHSGYPDAGEPYENIPEVTTENHGRLTSSTIPSQQTMEPTDASGFPGVSVHVITSKKPSLTTKPFTEEPDSGKENSNTPTTISTTSVEEKESSRTTLKTKTTSAEEAAASKSTLGESAEAGAGTLTTNKPSLSMKTTLTTQKPEDKENTCLTQLLDHSRQKNPNVLCDCDAGQMKIDNACKDSNVTTFKLDFREVCGEKTLSQPDKQLLAISKIRDTVPYASCIQDSREDVIVNLACAGCTKTSIENKHFLADKVVDTRVAALNSSLCSISSLNYCSWKANCTTSRSGFQIKCTCKRGTTDISNGTGRICEGIPEDDDCIMVFGACLIFWLMLLLGLLFLIPLLGTLYYKFRARNNRVQPAKPLFTKRGNRSTRGKNPENSHVAIILGEALKGSAKGTGAVAAAMALTSIQPKRGSKIVRNPGTQGEMPERSPPTSIKMQVPNPTNGSNSRLNQIPLDANSLPGMINVNETPILDKEGSQFERRSAGSPHGSVAQSTKSLKDYNLENGDKAALQTSESAPALPISASTTPLTQQTSIPRSDTASLRSIGVQPTIWESYRVLGNNYSSTTPEKRTGSASSLEELIKSRYPTPPSAPAATVTAEAAPAVPTPTVAIETEATVTPPTLTDTNVVAHNETQEIPIPDVPSATVESLVIDNEPTAAVSSDTIAPSTEPTNKLAEMLGVTLDGDRVETKPPEDNDNEVLVEMAKRGIDLPLTITTELPYAAISESTSEETPTPADIPDVAKLPLKPKKFDPSEKSRRKELTKRQSFIETRQPRTPLASRLKTADGKLKPEENKKPEKPPVFVPMKARQKTPQSVDKPRGRIPIPIKTGRLQPPPEDLMNSSTDESDPEVSLFKRLSKTKNFTPGVSSSLLAERRRHPRRPVRTLSSISEKSAEIAAEAAIQEYHKDYSISCPNTTRSIAEWNNLFVRSALEKVSDDGTDADLPPTVEKVDIIHQPIISSPDIPDVTERRSLDRLDAMMSARSHTSADIPSTEFRGISVHSRRSTTSHKSKGFDNSRPPSSSSNASMAIKENHRRPTSRSSRRSTISRRIAMRRHEMQLSQSARDLTQDSSSPDLRPRSYKSAENLRNRPPWDSTVYRDGDEKQESFLPPIKAQIRSKSYSVLNSPYHSRRHSRMSLHSVRTHTGSSYDMSPIFDVEKDSYKRPKEDLWWGHA